MSDLSECKHIIPHSYEYQDEALEIEVTVSEDGRFKVVRI